MLTFNKLFLALAFLGSSAAAQAADGNADLSRTDFGKNTERADRLNGLRRSIASSTQVGSWSQTFSQQPVGDPYAAGYGNLTARVNGVSVQTGTLAAADTAQMSLPSTTRLFETRSPVRTVQQSPSLSLSESPHTYLPVHHVL
ncbi:hypothetical protein EC919_11729 [Pseudomonas graminis]|uniref:hypothetical protein n=1 Tax=Pseudomonas graminis TaxID=158627 RepID=UPI00105EE1ED|nr:hypothetical protein [Pseudomonas graminis]TDV42768.1 hypothetical protein EC919_11729 [Pseudomonas graminis]